MSRLGRALKVRGNTNQAPGEVITGELVNGRPVYVEKRPNLIRRQQTGPAGEKLWHRHPSTQEPLRKRMEKVQDPKNPWLEREYQKVDLGNGMVVRNYAFRPTEEDLLRQELGDTGQLDPAALKRQNIEQQAVIDTALERIAQLEALVGKTGPAPVKDESPAEVEVPEATEADQAFEAISDETLDF